MRGPHEPALVTGHRSPHLVVRDLLGWGSPQQPSSYKDSQGSIEKQRVVTKRRRPPYPSLLAAEVAGKGPLFYCLNLFIPGTIKPHEYETKVTKSIAAVATMFRSTHLAELTTKYTMTQNKTKHSMIKTPVESMLWLKSPPKVKLCKPKHAVLVNK